jgi:signal transduction histidine kinase
VRRSKPGPASQQASRGNFTPPPRTAASPADIPGVAPASGSRLSPRNWRVPTRLNAILLIPVLVGLVFGGIQVNSSIETWREAQDAERTARLVRAAATYAHALIDERDVTAVPLLKGERDSEIVTEARAATDRAKDEFDAQVEQMPDKPGLKRRLKAFRDVEPDLAKLREGAYTPALPGAQTEEGYVKVQHPLTEFANELGLGTGNITSYGRTVYAITLAKGAESLQRSIGTHLLVKPGPAAKDRSAQVTAFTSFRYLEGIALQEYISGGTAEDQEALKTALEAARKEGEKKVAEARRQAEAAGVQFVAPPPMDDMVKAIGSGTGAKDLGPKGITPETWFATATGKFDAYRTIERDLVDKAVDEAAQISDDAKQDAIVNGTIVIIALLTAFVIAGLMARSMSRSMLRLRTAAFDVAEQRLPMLVDQLSRTDPGRVDTRVQPIPITSQDEIGEVARAFDQVHREAVRLAAEQALLRGNVNAIFTNLSRRNQGLIEGQLTLITELENNEADPDQLQNLFRLDHLATRMRRNGENLLVLAGEEPGRRWNQPVPLVDVLRAATSEVESYERIEISGVPESEIHGQAVTDLVHLLSELLENATTFSSPQTKVRVTATRLPDGRIMIEIHDKGIGLTAEDFADINHKLANPPTVDAAISQRMGLFVVGRLADRHSIRVQLRPSGEQAGTTSLIMLPDAITHGGGGDELPEDDFTVSRIVPEQPQPYNAQPYDEVPQAASMPTAADLGFDDSRYDMSPELDPVGRSLLREERRAQLEAQSADEPSVFREGAEPHAYPDAQQGYETAEFPQATYPESGYQDSGYADSGYQEAAYGESGATGQQAFAQYDGVPQQSEWDAPATYESRYERDYGAESESQGAPAEAPDRVGFDRSGFPPATAGETPTPNGTHSLTGVGLPRREKAWQRSEEPERTQQVPRVQQDPQDSQGLRDPQQNGGDWHSANDERWKRAEQLRDPKAGGVTSSGLPRRVPKANLVEGTAEQTPQGGPQVSRAPEDVRGRLSNLRRGVQRGRNAGTDTGGQGFGPGGSNYDQER